MDLTHFLRWAGGHVVSTLNLLSARLNPPPPALTLPGGPLSRHQILHFALCLPEIMGTDKENKLTSREGGNLWQSPSPRVPGL